jgi:glycosyltransferase involved in cell wall biosynthesis
MCVGGDVFSSIALAKYLPRFGIHVTGLFFEQQDYEPVMDELAGGCVPMHLGVREVMDVAPETNCLICSGAVLFPKHRPEIMVYLARSDSKWVRARMGFDENLIHCAMISDALRSLFKPETKVAVLHNGVDTDRLRSTKTRQEARAELGFAPGDIVLGYVGRISRGKRPFLVSGIAEYLGKPFRAAVMGPRNGQDPPRCPKGTVWFDSDVCPGDFYQAIDICVLPSPAEGFCLTAAEAWLTKRPLVSTRVGIVATHPGLAQLAPICGTVEKWAEAVHFARKRPETVERAYSVASERYTAVAMARRWAEYLWTIKGRHQNEWKETASGTELVSRAV